MTSGAPREAAGEAAILDPAATAAAAEPGPRAGKQVLLVDCDFQRRESRAKVLRSFGVEVHCAASASAARMLLQGSTYDLVLLDPERDHAGAEYLARQIRSVNPRQVIGFLVGSPLFVTKSLGSNGVPLTGGKAPASTAAARGTAKHMDFGQKIRDAEAEG